ncbi:endolytic transglycosylase MltG, partial [Candidatus Hakubella thermalkaliphila]
MNRTKKILIGVAVALLASLLLALFALYQFSAPQSKAPEERIIINLGTSEKELINQLHAQGYIRSPWAFNMVLTIKGWHGKIEPGGYLISKAMSAWTLADTLVNHPYQRWVLLPEGLRVEELAEILGSKLRWGEEQKSDFLNFAQEGYMFP